MKFGLKERIYACVVVILSVSLIIANYLSYQAEKASIDDKVLELSELTLRMESRSISDWFVGKTKALEAAVLPLQMSNDKAVVESQLLQLNHSLDLLNVLVAYPDGTTLGSVEGKLHTYRLEEYDPRTRPWYQGAVAARGTHITDLYQDASTDNMVVSIAVPVYRAGQLESVLLGDLSLDQLFTKVSNIEFSGGRALLIDSSHEILASYNPDQVGKTLTQFSSELDGLEGAMRAQAKGTATYNLNGVSKIGYFNQIDLGGGKTWQLLIAVSRDDVYKRLDEVLNNSIITALIMIVVGCSIIIFVLSRLFVPVNRLKQVTKSLTVGDADLTQRLPVNGNDELAEISQSINTFIANLQKIVTELATASEQIQQDTQHAKTIVDNNNAVLQSHQTETELVASAVTEMSSTAEAVAQNASEAAELARTASTEVTESRRLVDVTVNSMESLVEEVEVSSGHVHEMSQDTVKITTVLEVIQSIAEQTNLLALNAAIEAARAGEQGRGFAVVADEVRALAARTQDSTNEINEMLSRLNNGSELVVNTMDQTQVKCQETVAGTAEVIGAISTMNDVIVTIDGVNAQIATSAEEQRAVTEEISANINSIKEIADTLAGSGIEILTVTERIGDSNTQLNSIVQRFKI